MLRRLAIVSCCLLAIAAAGGRAPAGRSDAGPALEERERVRLRAVRIRAVPALGADPGLCAGLGVADLRVELRGSELPPGALDLEPDRRPALHALVIDTSGSMRGYVQDVRDAVAGYVALLRPERDRALVATFDDSLVLVEGPTGDARRLEDALDRVALGGLTALHDALYGVLRELVAGTDRPVLLLLSDGVDSSSVHDRADVWALAEARSDLTVFTVGFDLPPMQRTGPSGLSSSRRFLERLAARTGGKFFAAWTASTLPEVYGRIREMLDAESILTVLDPDPGAERGRLEVASRRSGCRIETVGNFDAAPRGVAPPAAEPYPASTRRLPLPPGEVVRDLYVNRAHHAWRPGCEPPEDGSDEGWYVEVERDGLRGCLADVFVETGMLYDPTRSGRTQTNDWLLLRTRPFRVPLAPPPELPDRAELLLDEVAREVADAEEEPEIDSRMRPREEHARPHCDLPAVVDGNAFFDARPRLARAMFVEPDYREWVLARLREEGERELAEIAARLGELVPGATAEAIETAARASEPGRSVLERMRTPTDEELARHVGAWLGDVSAHDLFVAWERDAVRGLVGGRDAAPESPSFADRWQAARGVFFAPSYSRALVPLLPVRDDASGRIGFWRVLLPRPAWFVPRLSGDGDHPDWNGPPLDLVPDLPLGHWALERVLRTRPELAERLREVGLDTESVEIVYSLRGKRRHWSPDEAFRDSRVELHLASDSGAEIEMTADVRLANDGRPALVDLTLRAAGDPRLERLAEAAEAELRATLAAAQE